MHDDNFDDGLVHNHNWAKEPPRPGVLLPAEQDARPADNHDDSGRTAD